MLQRFGRCCSWGSLGGLRAGSEKSMDKTAIASSRRKEECTHKNGRFVSNVKAPDCNCIMAVPEPLRTFPLATRENAWAETRRAGLTDERDWSPQHKSNCKFLTPYTTSNLLFLQWHLECRERPQPGEDKVKRKELCWFKICKRGREKLPFPHCFECQENRWCSQISAIKLYI